MARVTPDQIRQMKVHGERIPMLTAYDYPTAHILDEAGVPLLLVGDTLGMIILGYDSTLPVTVEDIIHHTRAVVRGTKRALGFTRMRTPGVATLHQVFKVLDITAFERVLGRWCAIW